jgi:hypothetical protein
MNTNSFPFVVAVIAFNVSFGAAVVPSTFHAFRRTHCTFCFGKRPTQNEQIIPQAICVDSGIDFKHLGTRSKVQAEDTIVRVRSINWTSDHIL